MIYFVFFYLFNYLFELNNRKQADIYCLKIQSEKHLCTIHYIALRKGLSIPSETVYEYPCPFACYYF